MLEQSSEDLPQYSEARLSKLRIDFWTTVDLSNDAAAEAISAYLEHQHPVWGPFDARLFLHDLIELRFDFCSAFMVNALLGIALVSANSVTMRLPLSDLSKVMPSKTSKP